MAASQTAHRPIRLALLAGAWMATLTTGGLAAGTDGGVPPGPRLLGKWYNGIGNGQYIRFQFTDAGAYTYSSPLSSLSGTFAINNDKLTLKLNNDKLTLKPSGERPRATRFDSSASERAACPNT